MMPAGFTRTPILMRERTSQMVLHQELVYGILGDNLVLLPEDVATAAADDLGSIWTLKTCGEALPPIWKLPTLDH